MVTLSTAAEFGSILPPSHCLDVTQVVHNQARGGGGIWVRDGVLEVLGKAAITSNVAAVNGGGIRSENSTVTLKGSTTTSNNVADRFGGGVFQNAGDALLTVGAAASIADNEARRGGGVYSGGGRKVATCGDVLITDTADISRNTAARRGGGLFSNCGIGK